MTEFKDIERSASQTYSDFINKGLDDFEEAKDVCYELIRTDPDYLDSYTTLYSVMQSEEDFLGAEIMLNRAYDKALQLICPVPQEWPDNISWEHEENKHVIRALLYKALDFWMGDHFTESKEILGLLHKSNPDAQLGFEYYLLAVQLKMDYTPFMERYVNEGMINESGQRWFEKNHYQLKS